MKFVHDADEKIPESLEKQIHRTLLSPNLVLQLARFMAAAAPGGHPGIALLTQKHDLGVLPQREGPPPGELSPIVLAVLPPNLELLQREARRLVVCTEASWVLATFPYPVDNKPTLVIRYEAQGRRAYALGLPIQEGGKLGPSATPLEFGVAAAVQRLHPGAFSPFN